MRRAACFSADMESTDHLHADAHGSRERTMLHNLLAKEGFNALLHGKHGYFLYNKNDLYVGKSLAFYGEWSEPEVDLFREICGAGDTVIEIGSNIGCHTIPLAKIVGTLGHIYAFEPQRIVYQTLCANIALNSLTQVEAFQVAVASEAGTAILPDIDYTKEDNFGGTRACGHEQGMAVAQVTLDGSALLSLESLRLLKVDAETMELAIVRGAYALVTKCRPVMYLENDGQREELIAHVQSLGYTVYWHVVPIFNPHNFAGLKCNVLGDYASFNILCVPREIDYAPSAQFGMKLITCATDSPL